MINTARGLVKADDLTFVSMHEHLLIDGSERSRQPREDPPESKQVSIETLGFIKYNYEALSDNLVLDDDNLAAAELKRLSVYPGSAIVDLTCIGLGQTAELASRVASISRVSGVHVILGCGFYVGSSHPSWTINASIDDMATFLLGTLKDGFGETGIKPGIIGEIGTSSPLQDREKKALVASAIAATETGAAVNVHVDPFGMDGELIVKLLLSQGLSPDRIVLSHMDAYFALNPDYHKTLLNLGVVLSFDNFGLEAYSLRTTKWVRNNSDLERLHHLSGLVDTGWEDQLVIGSDVYSKVQLARYGGAGYDHLPKRIIPALIRDLSVASDALQKITADTPRRLLAWI